MMLLLLLCLLRTGPVHLPGAEDADLALLPPDGFRQVWKRSERAHVFASADLYGHIDGGAELFLEFGFEQLTVQTYIAATGADSNEIQVEIYRMTDPEATAGVYLLKCGKESPVPAFGERHTLNKFQLLFMRDRYFVVVNNPEGNDMIKAGMLDFARYIASRLPPASVVKAISLLPTKGLVEGSIRLARGPYALQSIYTLGEGDILQLGRRLTAVSAQYEEAAGRHTRILVEYPDETVAAAAFSFLGTNLDSYLKIEDKGEHSLAFKDYAGEYGLLQLDGNRIRITLHLSKKPAMLP